MPQRAQAGPGETALLKPKPSSRIELIRANEAIPPSLGWMVPVISFKSVLLPAPLASTGAVKLCRVCRVLRVANMRCAGRPAPGSV